MHASDPPEFLELFDRIVELRSSATSFDLRFDSELMLPGMEDLPPHPSTWPL